MSKTAVKGYIARPYEGLREIATVTCGCGEWADFDCPPGESSAKKARKFGWRRTKVNGWLCPSCWKNKKELS